MFIHSSPPTRRRPPALAWIALLAAAGCSDEARREAEPAGDGEPVAVAAQALTSATACLSLRRTLAAGTVYDTQIVDQPSPKNYGTSGTMNVGTFNGSVRRTLLAFDLSTIPAGAVVTSATVGLYLSASATAPVNVHRVTAPWNEMLVTWQTFGGAYDPAVLASFSSGPPQSWVSVADAAPILTTFRIEPLVQAWLSGATPNHGIVLDEPDPPGQTLIRGSEWFPVYQRPELLLCYHVVCPGGYADCDGDARNGCETPITTTSDCGACGNACALPHAANACVGGACAIGSCDAGYGDCDGDPRNGCETTLATPSDCGACGASCALANAQASCATGTCALVACDAGHHDCDGDPRNGCEPLPCGDGSRCGAASDCASGICQGGYCATPICSDGVANGGETDVDCGGGCPPCADGRACAAAADCASGVCAGGLCRAPACNDGVKNGVETSVDCGGGCSPCADGQACAAGADCANKICLAGVCQSATCNDGAQNGGEADVDCGGPSCPSCGVAARCLTSADCVSGVCLSGTCQAPTCNDGVLNGNETGVDCGGACFKPEVCNGVDDDCNGLVDDGLGTITCGLGACQRTVPACQGGQPQTCVPGAPQAEICDGLIDDDCDGVVDDGCACVNGATQPCYTASAATLGVGACAAGTQTCVMGQWGACVGEVTPTQETCNGRDDDCDGAVDDGLGQTVCGVGACKVTAPNCAGGHPQACVPGNPSPEVCDGIDNDCNGLVDDVTQACTVANGWGQRTCNAQGSGFGACNVTGCATDHYLTGGACSHVGSGYYSPNGDLQRYPCSNKPANASYGGPGGGGNACPWSCDGGYYQAGGACSAYSYGWQTGGWGGCSASCGGGTQTRSVWCQRSPDGATVADAYCGGGRPGDTQSCNTQSCGPPPVELSIGLSGAISGFTFWFDAGSTHYWNWSSTNAGQVAWNESISALPGRSCEANGAQSSGALPPSGSSYRTLWLSGCRHVICFTAQGITPSQTECFFINVN